MLNFSRFAGLVLAIVLSSSAWAQQGPGYQVIDPPLNTRTADKVEVLEYFWFGCPHCYAFEPTINDWAANKPDHVEFVREAPPLNPGWMPHSKAFYAAEIMGVTDKFFDAMFHAIHQEKRPLRKARAIADFAGELGIDADLFYETMQSFGVQTRIKEAMRMARASGINGVPSIVINGKFKTGNSLAGGHEGIISVINQKVAAEHN